MRKIMPALAAMLALGATASLGVATADTAPVDAETLSPDKVNAMLDAGWYGDPTDQAERLYSPDACRVIDVTDVPKVAVSKLLAKGFKGNPNDGREALYAPSC